jgi:hypothetical protein
LNVSEVPDAWARDRPETRPHPTRATGLSRGNTRHSLSLSLISYVRYLCKLHVQSLQSLPSSNECPVFVDWKWPSGKLDFSLCMLVLFSARYAHTRLCDEQTDKYPNRKDSKWLLCCMWIQQCLIVTRQFRMSIRLIKFLLLLLFIILAVLNFHTLCPVYSSH